MNSLLRSIYGISNSGKLQEDVYQTSSYTELLDKNNPNGGFEVVYNIEEVLKELETCNNSNKRKDKTIEDLQYEINRLNLIIDSQPVSLFKKQKSDVRKSRKKFIRKKSDVRKSRKKSIRKKSIRKKSIRKSDVRKKSIKKNFYIRM